MNPTNLTSTILICDDQESCGEVLKISGKNLGCRFQYVSRKDNAIARISKIRPAIVTTDLTPDTGAAGSDVFDLIHAAKMYDSRVTLIVISGSLTPAIAKKAH